MDPKAHWETIYRTKDPTRVSWFQSDPLLALRLIAEAAPQRDAFILDVGGGASQLVDGLLRLGYRRLAVLDLSPSALNYARSRLGEKSRSVTWIEGDVLALPVPDGSVDIWHDRAVFHFLTDPVDRARYVAQVRRAVRPGGHVLVATFAEHGPPRCSGLEVAHYSAAGLHEVFGPSFHLLRSEEEDHITPDGVHQAFVYCLCRR